MATALCCRCGKKVTEVRDGDRADAAMCVPCLVAEQAVSVQLEPA